MVKFKYTLFLFLFFVCGLAYSQPSSPVLLEPPKGADVVGIPSTLDWSDVTGATCYFIEVTTDTISGPVIIDDSCNVCGSQYDIAPNTLSANTTYYWRVKAHNGTSWGTYSFYFSFSTSGTAQEEIDETQDYISGLVLQDALPGNQGNILNNRLRSASHQMDLNHPVVAELHVWLYKARLWILRASNIITSSVYNDLDDQGDYIIAVIRNLNNSVHVPVTVEPKLYNLTQNYPNPFNPSTSIDYTIPADGLVTLKVYNTLGQEVQTLVNEVKNAGTYIVNFNAGNLSSGVYFYRLQSGSFTETKRMILTK